MRKKAFKEILLSLHGLLKAYRGEVGFISFPIGVAPAALLLPATLFSAARRGITSANEAEVPKGMKISAGASLSPCLPASQALENNIWRSTGSSYDFKIFSIIL